jgi:succinate dehydrogenase/fumarate reductase flavoprotein subunit
LISIHGGGMAGLVAAARLRQLGREATLYEKGTRLGGSMLLSSCVVWRHRDWDVFRQECPDGDERLQRLVWEWLDDALEWLRSLGAPVVWEETGNPLTVGKRFDPAGVVSALAGAAARIELGSDSIGDGPAILCTGGFAASRGLVDRYIAPAASLRLRGNPWSTGDALEHALTRGAATSAGLGEFYGRNMPDAVWGEPEFVSASQLYARHARIFDETGDEFFESRDVSWSETNVVQATARRPGARAYYLLDEDALHHEVRDRAVSDLVAAAPPEARVDPVDLPFRAPGGTVAAVRVAAAITHTLGGLVVDERARVLRPDGSAIDGLWAAGVDVGGVAAGGYASGLAQALVLGLIAAESV